MSVEINGDGKSWIRKQVVDPLSYKIMEGTLFVLPGLTPDGVTVGGSIFNVALTGIQQQLHIWGYQLGPTGLKVFGGAKAIAYYSDKADGSLADVYDVKRPGQHSRKRGQRLDPIWDRRHEAWIALLRARTAFLEGDFVGEMAAYAAAITCVMPSTERARFETIGYGKAPEMGHNPLTRLGVRTTRCIFGEIANKSRTLQPYVDLATAGANLYAAYSRKQLYEQYKDVELPVLVGEEEQKRSQTIEFAHERLRDMEKMQAEIIGTTTATFILMRTLPRDMVALTLPIDFKEKVASIRERLDIRSKAA